MVFDAFGKKARAAATALAGFAGYTLWEANQSPAAAADLSGIKQSCNEAGHALLSTSTVDIKNSHTVQQNLLNYWTGVGDTARAQEVSKIQGGTWNRKTKSYEHADFISLQAALAEAQDNFTQRDQSCKTPAPAPQADLPNFANNLANLTPNLDKVGLELSAGVGVGVITMPGKDGVMGAGVNLTAFVPVEIADGVKVGPRADLRASGTLSTQSDAPNQGWTTDVDYTGQASVGIGGQVAVDLDEQTTAYAFLQKTWGEAGAFGRTAEHSSGLKVDLKDYTSSTEGLAAGAGVQSNGQQGEHQAVEFTYQRNEHEFLKEHGAKDKTDQSVMVTFKTGIGGTSKADDDDRLK